jgi:hypothetical protein
MTIENGQFIQGDTEKDIQEFCIMSLPRGKKREEARRRAKEDYMFERFGVKVKLPNKRVEGQKRRRAREYEAKRQERLTAMQCVQLANAWGGTYNLNKEEK